MGSGSNSIVIVDLGCSWSMAVHCLFPRQFRQIVFEILLKCRRSQFQTIWSEHVWIFLILPFLGRNAVDVRAERPDPPESSSGDNLSYKENSRMRLSSSKKISFPTRNLCPGGSSPTSHVMISSKPARDSRKRFRSSAGVRFF